MTIDECDVAKIGQPAPRFTGEAAIFNLKKKEVEFTKVSLEDNIKAKKWTVLFFYPLDFSSVCPTEIHAIKRRLDDFKKADAEVIGCSTDSKYCHKAWMERPRTKGGIDKLTFPLLEDNSLKWSWSYGVLDEELGIAMRGTFFIDPDGVLQAAHVNNADVGRNIDEVLRTLRALQTGALCQANWRPGRKTIN